MSTANIYIQGYDGSFHDAVAKRYFGPNCTVVPCDSFEELCQRLRNGSPDDSAVMAIENSIAGTILPNYKLLREYNLNIQGEVYKKIELNLIALHNQSLDKITEVRSHNMALKQCSQFLKQFPHLRIVESEDTAKSAKEITEEQLSGIACIASNEAASIYQLEILAASIEDIQMNYTRFFILNQNDGIVIQDNSYNKASIYMRLRHEAGSLVNALNTFSEYKINISKLQSNPVLGKFNEYYFHIDIEFDALIQYQEVLNVLSTQTLEVKQLGVYQKADVSSVMRDELTNYML